MLRRGNVIASSLLKILCENFTSVKSYGKTDMNIFILCMGKIQMRLNFFWPVYD